VKRQLQIKRPTYLDAAEVKHAIHLDRLFEADGHRLIGGGRQRSCLCPFHAERSPSCSVDVEKGVFHCFGCGASGDAFNYIQKRDGVSFPVALRTAAAFAGIRGADRPPVVLPPRPKPPEPVAYQPQPMPDDVAEVWHEGRELLVGRPLLLGDIARGRGWPEKFVHELAMDGMIAAPRVYGKRVPAFPVLCPQQLLGGGVAEIMVGFHCRISKEQGWRFFPNAKAHGRGVLPLPYLIGHPLHQAKVLFVLEGQWDALTAYLLLGRSFAAEHRVCCVGVRGKNGIDPFLNTYQPFWPDRPTVILSPDIDTDKATGKPAVAWRTPGGFRDQLKKRAGRLIDVETGAKDLNDAYRAKLVDRSSVRALISSICQSAAS
jgi:hypothetical protein